MHHSLAWTGTHNGNLRNTLEWNFGVRLGILYCSFSLICIICTWAQCAPFHFSWGAWSNGQQSEFQLQSGASCHFVGFLNNLDCCQCLKYNFNTYPILAFWWVTMPCNFLQGLGSEAHLWLELSSGLPGICCKPQNQYPWLHLKGHLPLFFPERSLLWSTFWSILYCQIPWT